MQIAGIFFRQLKQKAQAILCVLTSIFVIDAGKRAGKMYAQELISAYIIYRMSADSSFFGSFLKKYSIKGIVRGKAIT